MSTLSFPFSSQLFIQVHVRYMQGKQNVDLISSRRQAPFLPLLHPCSLRKLNGVWHFLEVTFTSLCHLSRILNIIMYAALSDNLLSIKTLKTSDH